MWATHHQCESNALQREAIIRQMEDLQKNTEKMLKDCDSEHAKQTDQQFQVKHLCSCVRFLALLCFVFSMRFNFRS